MRYEELKEQFEKDIEEQVRNAIYIVNHKWVEKLTYGKIKDLEALSQFDFNQEATFLLKQHKRLISEVLKRIADEFYNRERTQERG